VAHLASKFDTWIDESDKGKLPAKTSSTDNAGSVKSDIAKIIDTLNQLDDEAKKSSARLAPKGPTFVSFKCTENDNACKIYYLV